MQSADRRSQIAILVAAAAVGFALVGTALAGPEAMVRAISKSQVKRIAKKQANSVVDSREANLDVSSAKSANDSAKLGGQPPSAYASSKVEAYHEIGSPGEPSFAANWTNENPTSLSTAAFFKDPFGVVHLKGSAVRSGGAGIITTLPAGYRPPKTACFPSVHSKPLPEVATTICVFITGEVSTTGGGDGTFLLEGITFRAG